MCDLIQTITNCSVKVNGRDFLVLDKYSTGRAFNIGSEVDSRLRRTSQA